MRLNFAKPRVKSSDVRFNAELHEDTLNYERTSSLREKVQALAFHFTTHSNRHRLSYELALRDILPRRHMSVPYAYDASLRYDMPACKMDFQFCVLSCLEGREGFTKVLIKIRSHRHIQYHARGHPITKISDPIQVCG